MSTVTVKIKGLAEMQSKLAGLPDKVNRKVVRNAVAAGTSLVRDKMRELAPVYTGSTAEGHPPPGTLKRAVFMKRAQERSAPGREVYIVGVRHGKSRQAVGKKQRNLDAYYFRFIEFGTVKMSKRPFMRPAWDAEKVAAKDAIVNTLASGIAEVAKEK